MKKIFDWRIMLGCGVPGFSVMGIIVAVDQWNPFPPPPLAPEQMPIAVVGMWVLATPFVVAGFALLWGAYQADKNGSGFTTGISNPKHGDRTIKIKKEKSTVFMGWEASNTPPGKHIVNAATREAEIFIGFVVGRANSDYENPRNLSDEVWKITIDQGVGRFDDHTESLLVWIRDHPNSKIGIIEDHRTPLPRS